MRNENVNEPQNQQSCQTSVSDSASPLLIIGDVHGKVNEYWKILQKWDKRHCSIQVGDFGFKKQHEWHLKNIDFSQHQINFGNHDDYSFLHEQ